MDNTKGRGWLIAGIVVLVLILVGAVLLFAGGRERAEERAAVDAFAKCLSAKGATMYGAFWCPKCAATKKRFGSSFAHIRYVECDPRGENEQSELCISKDIDKYDTWEFADGSRLVGEPSFQAMSDKTGCPLPGGASGGS